MSADGGVPKARRIRRPADEVLMEWGGYVRTYKQAQGGLQRLVSKERDGWDRMPRSPGTHSDPVFANLAAEESLHIRRISAFDGLMDSYPRMWRQMTFHLFVRGGDLMTIAAELQLSERDAKGALSLIKRQAELDWAHTAYISRRENVAAAKAA